MTNLNPQSTAKIAGHPIHPMLIPFPIVFFVSTFACDLVSRTSDSAFWPQASVLLLGAGLVTAGLAALAGLTDFLGSRAIRAIGVVWWHMIGNVLAVVLELVNFLMRIGYPEATPGDAAVGLSGLVVLLLLFNGWMGWELVYRHRVGIAEQR